MKTNPFHFDGNMSTFPRYTSEQVAIWEAMCNERNFNTDISKYSTLKEMMYDIFTRLNSIEEKQTL